MLKESLGAIILLLAFPSGYLLAYLCKDELVQGRKWFKLLAILSLITSLVVAFFNFSGKFAVILTLFFIAIISLISVHLSYDKKFVKS